MVKSTNNWRMRLIGEHRGVLFVTFLHGMGSHHLPITSVYHWGLFVEKISNELLESNFLYLWWSWKIGYILVHTGPVLSKWKYLWVSLWVRYYYSNAIICRRLGRKNFLLTWPESMVLKWKSLGNTSLHRYHIMSLLLKEKNNPI